MRLFRRNVDITAQRNALFSDAKARLPELKRFYEPAHEQIEPQIEYLLAVNAGRLAGDRLEAITIGVIAAKWLDPCPDQFEFLFAVADEAQQMATEYKRARNA